MNPHPIRLRVSDELERSRLTVFFRLLLAIPHAIWLGLWSIVALLAAFANWFATLALGRSPQPLHRFLAAYVKYVTQFYAYVNLAANPYPAFDGQDGYPIDLRIDPPQRQSRWKVALRLPLALPAIALGAALGAAPQLNRIGQGQQTALRGLLGLLAILAWFSIMARGRMPRGLRDAEAWCLSYGAQLWAYLFLLTDRYPNSDPYAALSAVPVRTPPVTLRGEPEERRSRLTTFFRLPLCFPHFVWLALWSILVVPVAVVNWLATLLRGRPPAALHRFLSSYLRYSTSVSAFLYMLAGPFPGFTGTPGSYPLEVAVAEATRQSRWTVAFRLLLAIPAMIVSAAYGSLLALVAVLGWFASLVTGRMPTGLEHAGALALRYQAQLSGYLLILTDDYPYSGPYVDAAPPAAEPSAAPHDGADPFALPAGA